MEAVVLCELPAEAAGARERLLARLGRLGLSGRAKLSFAGRDQAAAADAAVVFAIGFPTLAEAERFAAAVPGDGLALATARVLRLDPVWQIEPLPLMFP